MRIGVLGLGFMGSTHLKALRTIPGAEIAAVYSRDASKLSGDLSAIQGNLGGPGERFDFSEVAKYQDIDELLRDSSVEAIDICLPTDLHAPVAIAALATGKHVLVEKPMALDSKTAEGMANAAEKHGRVLMCAQVLRFFPQYRALRELLSKGDLGTARYSVFSRRCAAPAWSGWLADAAQSGGGAFDLLIHDTDMCLHLFGDPESVAASGYESLSEGIDVLTAELHYSGERSIFICGGWHHTKSYPFFMGYTVVTDGGTLEYKSPEAMTVLYRADGVKQELASDDTDGYRAEIEYFLDCCRDNRTPELCPPRESAKAVKLMRMILDSRKQGGKRFAWQA